MTTAPRRVERGAPSRPTVVDLHRVRLPLVTPLVSAHGTETERDVALVRVELDSGEVGWGECSTLARPTYTSEYTAGAWVMLRDELAPALLAGRRSDVVGHPMAAAAVATALADADLRRVDRSLAEQLGRTLKAAPRATVPTCAVVGIAPSVDDTLAAVDAAQRQGVAMVKLKLRPSPRDVTAARAVRAAWPALPLAVDLNGSAGLGHLDVLAALDDLGLAYLEQPLPAADLVGSAVVSERLATPVALDESIASMADVATVARLGAASIVNVKPARLGGPIEAARVLRAAADHGLGAFCGGMLETGVGRAAALAVAAQPGCAVPTDLGPSDRYFRPDLTDAVVVDGRGEVVVPRGPGIGVVPDQARLDDVTVEHVRRTR